MRRVIKSDTSPQTPRYLVVLQIAQAAKASSQADDLYLDDTGSGGFYPEDDDDFNSGSGSGKTHLHTRSQAQQAISQRHDGIQSPVTFMSTKFSLFFSSTLTKLCHIFSSLSFF